MLGAVGPLAVRTANLQVLRDQFDSMIAPCSPSGVAAVADRAVGHRLPVRRLARSDRAAGSTGGQQGRQRRRRHCLSLSRRSTSWTRLQRLLRRSEDERHFADLAERTRTAFNEHYVHGDGTIRATRRRYTRWPSSSGCSTKIPVSSREAPRPRLVAERLPHPDRLCRHAVRS